MRKRLSLGIVLVSLLYVLAALAQALETPKQPPALPSPAKESVQRTLSSKPGDCFVVLNNGLTVLIRSQTESDVVSSQVFVRAGSIYEGKYLTSGISHYLEHVLSGGSTRSFTEEEAKERLERIGGATNASTSFERYHLLHQHHHRTLEGSPGPPALLCQREHPGPPTGGAREGRYSAGNQDG